MSTPEAERPRGVQSVDRALDILELLAGHQSTMGVTEIAREVGLAPGTTHRLLVALARRGWVRQDPGRRYGVGLAARRLGDASGAQLATLAVPALRAAVELTEETANLASLDGDVMVYVAQAPSPHTLRIFAEVGRRVPLHSTAVGKVVLARMEPARAMGMLTRPGVELRARTPRTLTDLDDLRAELDRVREQGYALDDEEMELGVRCVAVPVASGALGSLALSVSGPTERMTRERAVAAVPGLRQIAADLAERSLGATA